MDFYNQFFQLIATRNIDGTPFDIRFAEVATVFFEEQDIQIIRRICSVALFLHLWLQLSERFLRIFEDSPSVFLNIHSSISGVCVFDAAYRHFIRHLIFAFWLHLNANMVILWGKFKKNLKKKQLECFSVQYFGRLAFSTLTLEERGSPPKKKVQ